MINASGLSPVCFTLFRVDIYWYGVAYVVGMYLALLQARRALLKPPYQDTISRRDLDSFVLWAWVGVVAGGRLGHILFYDAAYYAHHVKEILAFRDGGMSFHGGLLGVIGALIIFCKRKNILPWVFLDLAASVAPIGLFVGRLANFVNNELYGTPTTLPWGCLFRGVEQPRHPTQIYEALLEGVVTFLILSIAGKKPAVQTRPGFVSALFLVCYALSRCLVDFVKDAPRYMGCTVGQWLSVGMLLAGTLWISRLLTNKRPPE